MLKKVTKMTSKSGCTTEDAPLGLGRRIVAPREACFFYVVEIKLLIVCLSCANCVLHLSNPQERK